MIIHILFFLCATHAVQGLERCLQCSAVTDFSTCRTVTCGANEVCFVERFINGHAENLYTLGCRSKTAIPCLSMPHAVGRRSGDQCGECCTGPNCQEKLCGPSGSDTTLSCRHCDYLVPGISSCTTRTTCDQTEACKIAIHVTGGLLRYEYGCEPRSLCQAFLSNEVSGRNAIAFLSSKPRNLINEGGVICSACCVTNDCNKNDCYTLHQNMTMAMFTTSPRH